MRVRIVTKRSEISREL